MNYDHFDKFLTYLIHCQAGLIILLMFNDSDGTDRICGMGGARVHPDARWIGSGFEAGIPPEEDSPNWRNCTGFGRVP